MRSLLFNNVKRLFSDQKWHHTTILALKRGNDTVIIGDGQVTYGSIRVKTDGRKIRKLGDGIYCGFAGSLADAFALMEGLEQVMSKNPNQTLKSCINYAKQWRTGRQLKHL
jgi:ATP-dependent HslUV protease subunit HslV